MPFDDPFPTFTADDRGLMIAAFRSSFPSFKKVREAMLLVLNDEVAYLKEDPGMESGAFDLVLRYERQGRCHELARVLWSQHPSNTAVRTFLQAKGCTPAIEAGLERQSQGLSNLDAIALELASKIRVPNESMWVGAGRRLYLAGDIDSQANAGTVIRTLAGLADREKAGILTTALLLRMAELADMNPALIQDRLRMFTDAANRLKQNVFGAQTAYVLDCDFTCGVTGGAAGSTLQVQRAWFFCANSVRPAEELLLPEGGIPLQTALDGPIADHMDANSSLNATIEILAPLRELLHPPIIENEEHFLVLYRWNERAESQKFRHTRRTLIKLTKAIKLRSSYGLTATWLDPVDCETLVQRMEADAAMPVDFPALRLISKAEEGDGEREKRLEEFLATGAPFAAVMRSTACAEHDEAQLISCVQGTKELARVPLALRSGRRSGDPKCILSHLTILWDDCDRNPFHRYQP